MRKLNRRDFLRLSAAAATGAVVAACAPATPVVVEKEVIKEVPVEKAVVVEKEVVKEVPVEVEKVVEKVVVKEVPVEKVVQVTPKPGERVTIRFMSRAHSNKGLMFFPQIIQTHFTEELHPEIKVEVEPAPGGWTEKLVTAMIAGTAVDVFQAWPAIFYVWIAKDLILDIQPYVDRDVSPDDIDDFLEAQWSALKMRGVRAGMPKYVDTRCMAYNMDVFDEYGVDYPSNHGADWDWEDLTEMAEALTKDVNGDGQIDLWGADVGAGVAQWDAEFFYWLRSFGGDYVNPDDPTDCWLDEPGSQECMNWVYQNVWVKEPNPFSRPEDAQGWYDDFVAGRLAMTRFGTRPAEQSERVGQQIRWDYAHNPVGPVRRCGLGDADAWSIWKGTKHPEAAWELIKFLSGPVFQELGTLRAEGTLPVRQSLMDVALKVYREEFPSVADKYLEIIPEFFEMGYLENVAWFEDHDLAMELIVPAMEKVFSLGEADPSSLEEVCAQVEEQQKSL